MASSDSDFDEDDDHEILAALSRVKSSRSTISLTPKVVGNVSDLGPNSDKGANGLQSRLYASEGEAAILRAQIQQLNKTKQEEIASLKEAQRVSKLKEEEKIRALQFDIQRLEDERVFLNNEIKNFSGLKRRKIGGGSRTSGDETNLLMEVDGDGLETTKQAAEVPSVMLKTNTDSGYLAPQKIVRIQNDASLFTDHIWNHCANGSTRTVLDFLGKIYVDERYDEEDFHVQAKTPISMAITQYLMLKKGLRLDELVTEFCEAVSRFSGYLVNKNSILAVPFLLALVHGSLNFRPSAVTQSLTKSLLKRLCPLALKLSFLLDSSQDEEDLINYHDVPNQVMVLEKFTLICCLDTVETLMTLTTMFGPEFIQQVWNENYLPEELFKKCFPENTERFKGSSQVNIIFNFVEIILSSVSETTFAYNDTNNKISNGAIVNSLLKVLIIDFPIKEDFMFYGLNRLLGNNIDIKKVESIIPESETILRRPMISIPGPIADEFLKEKAQLNTSNTHKNLHIDQLSFNLERKHELHLLNLRLNVVTLLETYIIQRGDVSILELKEHIKSIVRTIGLQQVYIAKLPRSETLYLRVQIIAVLVRILYYIVSEKKWLNDLTYPETLYEVFVSFLRIAFGSNSLSTKAHDLLVDIRHKKKYNHAIFNRHCERRARETNHLAFADLLKYGKDIADTESEFANGLEFPYEAETIELAREILDSCVTHEEADNLYFNMNHEDVAFDEMDLVDP